MNQKETLENNLNYIGLDLNNLPQKLIEFENLEYRPQKYGDEKFCKKYKYINVDDIKILLTPTNRLDEMSEKYTKASPIYEYLKSDDEQDIEKHTTFLKMLDMLRIEELQELEKKQETLKKQIPFKVKFEKDYLWQIYYSESKNQYFMLAPIRDSDYSALFYLLKKQLENKNEKIYVPVCYSNYSEQILKTKEIENLENYLWLFTKRWPLTYEVYDLKGNNSINIIGETIIYENIESIYKIKLEDKDNAFEFYKLVKALFVLQTELPHYYKFDIKINDVGGIEFTYQNNKINYDNLSTFIKEQYLNVREQNVKNRETRINLEKELESLKEKTIKLDNEYILKEKQISTFLECKKSFFGKVKYFFKYKKIAQMATKEQKDERTTETKQKIHYCERPETKENYTLEEIIDICKNLDKETNIVKNLKLDIHALQSKIQRMENKIKSSIQYIKEIDNHKKSIFDFWRFTNKENTELLGEGELKQQNRKVLKKVFDYEMDFEDFAKRLDTKERTILSKKECDSVFIASTDIIKDLNLLLTGQKIEDERLKELKKEAEENEKLVSKKDFDIFGGAIEESKTNEKHRETKKDKFKVLEINQETTLTEYTDKLNNILIDINNSFDKNKFEIEIPIYMMDKELNDNLNIFNINANEVINKLKQSKAKGMNLYKIKLNEDSKTIGLSNIIYYDNTNKTLPLGMDEGSKILINNKKLKLELINKDYNKIAYEEKGKVIIKDINIFEFNCI